MLAHRAHKYYFAKSTTSKDLHCTIESAVNDLRTKKPEGLLALAAANLDLARGHVPAIE